MFDISWGELLIIGVVALVVIGPKELPGVLRTTGQWMGKVRRMASEFQDQFREAMREAELEDAKKQFDDISNTASNFTNFDPIGTVRREFESLVSDKPKDATEASPTSEASSTSAPEPDAAIAPPTPPETTATETGVQAESEPPRKAGEGA